MTALEIGEENIYTTIEDLGANYAKKTYIQPSIAQFIYEEGFPYFTVKNENLTTSTFETSTNNYNALSVILSDEFKEKLYTITTRKDSFKIVLCKDVVYDLL